jgi:small subunit ribosomal protein S15
MLFEKKTIVEQFKTHSTDTGSPEVQTAILTSRINYLSEHFQKFPKDFASKVGFIKLIAHRRRLLDYLKRTKKDSYALILKKLNLRK